MAVLVMIVRKMLKNRWLESGLLCGMMLAVALASSMPIYKEAILQSMLLKDLQRHQLANNVYPGNIEARINAADGASAEERKAFFESSDRFVEGLIPRMHMPLQLEIRERVTASFRVVHANEGKRKRNLSANLAAYKDLEQNVRIVDGKFPASEPVNGVYEAAATNFLLTEYNLVVGDEFSLVDHAGNERLRIKIAGVIAEKEGSELYFSHFRLQDLVSSFILPYETVEREFLQGGKLPLNGTVYYLTFDYTQLHFQHLDEMLRATAELKHRLNTTVEAEDTVHDYLGKAERLQTLLFSLNVPVFTLLASYLFMVSNLIVERQKTEIAVLRSRGAGRWQIVAIYLLEGLLLGAVALIVGPFVGLLFTRFLGATDGFMELVNRTALDVRLSAESYRYALAGVAFSIAMMLLPALAASRTSIVSLKQTVARSMQKPLWLVLFLDLVLIAAALYGLYLFDQRMENAARLQLEAGDLSIDPLLFVAPTIFVVGTGLFMLRVYPWLLRFIYWTGKRWWPPTLYNTLIRVGRSPWQYQLLMIFLMLTVAIGMFSAGAARTINENIEDRIRYKNGADIVFTSKWPTDFRGGGYVEPPESQWADLPGVLSYAKVYNQPEATAESGNFSNNVRLLGIETDDFGRTAWFKHELHDRHLFHYLNLLGSNPSAVLINRTMAEDMILKPGDEVRISWKGVNPHTFIVYGIVDYFPTFNPNPRRLEETNEWVKPYLVVGNLKGIQNRMGLEPYEIWLKLEEGASRRELLNALDERGIQFTSFKDGVQELLDSRNEPFRLTVNAVMTLGFLISLTVTFFGFLIYWLMSLGARTLQFGVFRAIGVSFRQLNGMMAVEQLLTSGAGILCGWIAGRLTSRLYVPLFQLSFKASEQIPPFMTVIRAADLLQLYVMVAVMIGLALVILGIMLSRIRIHQAVKLGED